MFQSLKTENHLLIKQFLPELGTDKLGTKKKGFYRYLQKNSGIQDSENDVSC